MGRGDGPGPLIYLGVAAVVATPRWRFAPLLAVAMSAFFLLGGLASADFTSRLIAPGGVTGVAAWLQMLSFTAAAVCGTAAVRRRRATSPSARSAGQFHYNSSKGRRVMGTIGARFSSTPASTKLSLAGLAIGIVGLVVQWIADPAKFGGFPPGIIVIVVCAALVVVASGRWWAPVFSVLISLWIILGGLAAGKLIPNLRSPDAGTVAGTVVMSLGLLFAAATGLVTMVSGRRARRGAVAG